MAKFYLILLLSILHIPLASMQPMKKNFPWLTTNPFFKQENEFLFRPFIPTADPFQTSHQKMVPLSQHVHIVINTTSDCIVESYYLNDPIEYMSRFEKHGFDKNIACQALRQRTFYFNTKESYCTKNQELFDIVRKINERKTITAAIKDIF